MSRWIRWRLASMALRGRLRALLSGRTGPRPLDRHLELSELESRVLLSASPVAAVATEVVQVSEVQPDADIAELQDQGTTAGESDASVTADSQQSGESNPTAGPVTDRSLELVFVDSDVSDISELLDDLWSNQSADREFRVVLIDAQSDGIDQITEALRDVDQVDAIHVVSHGTEGRIKLGSNWLDLNTLPAYASRIAGWHGSLSADADILFYGCELAGNADGRELLEALTALTGADVAASVDDTGAAIAGGNWELEFQSGTIETTTAFSATIQASWDHLLAPSTPGVFIWRNFADSTPDYATWDGTAVGASANAPAVGELRIIQGADSPTRDERIILGVDTSGQIEGLIWNGTSWSVLPISLGTVSQTFWWSVDVQYESTSGDAVLVWADGSNLEYATWNGSSWSTVNTIATYSGATPRQLQLASNPITDEMVLVVSDSNSHDFALVWNGSSWGPSTALATNSSDDRTDINVAYEQVSGRAIVVYGDNNADARYRIWNGTAWGAEKTILSPGTVSGAVRWTTLATSPNSNRIALGVTTFSSEIWLSVWDGFSWNSTLHAGNSSTAVAPVVAVAFESKSGDLLATYSEPANEFRFRTWSSAGGWSPEQNGPNLLAIPNSMTLTSDRYSNHIMLAVQDNSFDLRVVDWDGSAWASPIKLANHTDETKNQPFLFLYDNDGSPAPRITVSTGATSYTENDPATVLDPSAVVSDLDTGIFSGGTLTATLTAGGSSDDRLDILNTGSSPGEVGVSGTTVLYGGIAVGSYAGGTDPGLPLSITFNSNATRAAVEAVVRSLTFANVSESPSTQVRTIELVLTDGDSETSLPVSIQVSVIARNDAPVGVTASAFSPIAEDAVTNPGKRVSDFTASTTDVDNGSVKGIAVTGTDTTNGTWEYTLDGSTWNDIGPVSTGAARLLPADTLTRVRFVPDANYNGTATPFTFVAWDQTSGVAGGVADTSVRGGESAFSTATASVSQIVTPVNDPPTSLDQIVTTDEDVPYIFLVTDFGFSDIDTGDTLAQVRIESLPSGGQLTLSGASVTLNDVITRGDINAGNLVYTPGVDAFGVAYDSFDYRVHDGTTFAASGSSISIDVQSVNDAPVITTPGLQVIAQDVALTFSAANANAITIADVDAATTQLRVSLSASSGTLSLSSGAGLTFTSGDGVNDAAMEFRGLAADINAALEGLLFTPLTGFNGFGQVYIDVDDQGGTGAGAAQADAKAVTIRVGSANLDTRLWLSTAANVNSSGIPNLDSFVDGQVIGLGNPDFALEPGTTAGSFVPIINLDDFGDDGNVDVDGIHYVSTSLTLGAGANTFDLLPGDLLLTTKGDEDFNSGAFKVRGEDVFVFRPTTVGDYSSGTIHQLLVDFRSIHGEGEVQGLTLVEQDTVVGDTTITAGTLLFTTSGASKHSNIYAYTSTGVGDGTTTGTLALLLDGGDIGIQDKIFGLDLVESDQVLGGHSLASGTLLVSIDRDDSSVGNNGIGVRRQEIFTLTVTATGSGTTSADATLLFEGADVNLDTVNETLDAFTLVPALPPELDLDSDDSSGVTGANYQTTYVEDSPPIAVTDADATIVDTDSLFLSSLTVTIANLQDSGSEFLAADTTGTAIASTYDALNGVLTLTGVDLRSNYQQVLRSVTYSNSSQAPDTTDRTIEFVVFDGYVDSNIASTTVHVTSRNDAPTLTGGVLAAINEDTTDPAGATISVLFSGQFSDPDPGAALTGIAVVKNPANPLTQGSWQYSSNLGVNWFDIGSVADDATALVLEAATQLRFVPVANFAGTPPGLSVRGLDNTYSGTFSTTAGSESRVVIDTSVNGGTTAVSTDPGELTTSVTPVNDTPQMSDQSFTIAENTVNGVNVGTVIATDADSGDQLSYAITGGTGATAFEIDAVTGTVRVIDTTQLDFEASTALTLEVSVQDDGTPQLTNTATITIQLTDANDNLPVIDPGQSFTVIESAANGVSLGSVTATDVDTVGSFQNWTITAGNVDGIFAINAATGELTIGDNTNLDFETTSSYTLTLNVSDGVNTSATETLSITITDANETGVSAVVDLDSAADFVLENQSGGTAVGITISATDADGTDTVTYSLLNSAGGLFSIDVVSGVVSTTATLDAESATSYTIIAQALSTDGSTSTRSFAITVGDLNEFAISPIGDVDPAPDQILENSTPGTPVGITALAVDTDVTTNAVTYSLDDTAGGRFQIDPSTGLLSVAGSLDYESFTSHTVVIRAVSQDGSTVTRTLTVDVLDANDNSPVIDPAQSFSVNESATNGFSLGTVTAADVDTVGTLQNWTITAGNADGIFAIDAATGELTIADNTNLDFETTSSYSLTLTVSDGVNTSVAETITITITDANDNLPVIDPGQSFTVIESATNGFSLGTVAAVDVDTVGSLQNWTITAGNADGIFAIDAATGELTVGDNTNLDFETTASYALRLTVSDGVNTSAVEIITITITDANETSVSPISDADNAADLVLENQAAGTAVGITAFAFDADGTDTVSYSLLDTAGGRFMIDPTTGMITTTVALDAESATGYTIVVRALSTDTSTSTRSFIVSVGDVNEFAVSPIVDTDPSTDQIMENSAAGTVVGITALAVDADVTSNSITYSLDDTAGGRFQIDPSSGVLTVSGTLDYESNTAHSIVVRAESQDGSSVTRTFNIVVLDANDNLPVITPSQLFSINESDPTGTSLGTVAASDLDTVGILQNWQITGGNTDGLFAINAVSGELVLANTANLDFEVRSSYTLTVTVSDGVNTSADETIAITITDANDNLPVIDPGQSFSVNESAANGFSLGQATAVDIDTVGALQDWKIISGNSDGIFAIDSVTGELTIADNANLDFESTANYTLTLTVSDGVNTSAVETIAITVIDANDNLPVIDPGQSFTVSESAPNGFRLGSVTANDVDTVGSFQNWTITSGNTDGIFAIDSFTGELTVLDSTGLDFEMTTAYTLTLSVSDGVNTSVAETVDITVTDADEFDVSPISDTDPQANQVLEGQPAGTFVGLTAFAEDLDGTDSVSYSLTDSAGGRFTIDASTGVVTTATVLDAESNQAYVITVLATSTDNSQAAETFLITVIDVNEYAISSIADVDPNPNQIAEGTTVGGLTGITAFARDLDVTTNVVTYSLLDSAAGRFAIDPSTGVVTVAGTLDYESQTSHVITIQATSADGSSSTYGVWISVLDVNDNAPVIAAGQSFTVSEDAAAGTLVAFPIVTDVDTVGGFNGWTIVAGNQEGWFSIDPFTGVLSLSTAGLDFESRSSFVLTLNVSDGINTSTSEVITINVLNVDDTITTTVGESIDDKTDDDAADSDGDFESQGLVPVSTSIMAADEGGRSNQRNRGFLGSNELLTAAFSGIVTPESSRTTTDERSGWGSINWEMGLGGLIDRGTVDRIVAVDPLGLQDGPILSTLFFDQLDDFRREVATAAEDRASFETFVIRMTAGTSVGISVGYVFWLLRGGSLLAAFLSTAPAWTMFDPIPILTHLEDDEDDQKETLSEIARGGRA